MHAYRHKTTSTRTVTSPRSTGLSRITNFSSLSTNCRDTNWNDSIATQNIVTMKIKQWDVVTTVRSNKMRSNTRSNETTHMFTPSNRVQTGVDLSTQLVLSYRRCWESQGMQPGSFRSAWGSRFPSGAQGWTQEMWKTRRKRLWKSPHTCVHRTGCASSSAFSWFVPGPWWHFSTAVFVGYGWFLYLQRVWWARSDVFRDKPLSALVICLPQR